VGDGGGVENRRDRPGMASRHPVPAAEGGDDGAGPGEPVDLRRRPSVERRHRPDLAGEPEEEGVAAAQAESGDPHPTVGAVGPGGDPVDDLPGEGDERPLPAGELGERLRHAAELPALDEVGGDGEVAVVGEAVGDAADVVVEPPHLAHDDDGRPRTVASRPGDVAGEGP